MKNKSEIIQILGNDLLKSEDLINQEDWQSASFIFEVGNGYITNSGYIYTEEKIIPAIAEIEDDIDLIDEDVLELRDSIQGESGSRFIKLLVQISREGNIKVDFEFDDLSRWKVTPVNMEVMREEIRPDFS